MEAVLFSGAPLSDCKNLTVKKGHAPPHIHPSIIKYSILSSSSLDHDIDTALAEDSNFKPLFQLSCLNILEVGCCSRAVALD